MNEAKKNQALKLLAAQVAQEETMGVIEMYELAALEAGATAAEVAAILEGRG